MSDVGLSNMGLASDTGLPKGDLVSDVGLFGAAISKKYC